MFGFMGCLYSAEAHPACHIRALPPGSLLWLAPPCGTWIYLSRGSRRLQSARQANRLIRRMVYIIHYARSKGIEFALEQPSSSLAPCYRPFLKMMKRTGARSISVPLGAWGARTETHDLTVCCMFSSVRTRICLWRFIHARTCINKEARHSSYQCILAGAFGRQVGPVEKALQNMYVSLLQICAASCTCACREDLKRLRSRLGYNIVKKYRDRAGRKRVAISLLMHIAHGNILTVGG